MQNQNSDKTTLQAQAENRQVLTVIWIVFLCSHLILVFVGNKFLFLPKEITYNSTVGSIIISLSIGMLIFSRIAFRKATLLSANLKQATFNSKSFAFYLMAWATGEAITVLGIMYGVTGGNASYQFAYYFFLAGIFLHILQRPKFY